jgi:hypothetical protein
MRIRYAPFVMLAMLAATPAASQLGLPPVGAPVGSAADGVLGRTSRALDPVGNTVGDIARVGQPGGATARRLSWMPRAIPPGAASCC